MISIGETLRRERLKRNLDLEQISHELKISSRLLEAIEEEKFDKLPGGVFAKSFVRQYARILGLDEEEIAGEVQRVLEPPPEEPNGHGAMHAAVPEIRVPRVEAWETVNSPSRFNWSSTLPALALVVVVMLLCSGVYAWWQRSRHPAAVSAMVQTAQPPTASVQPPAAPPASAPPVAAASVDAADRQSAANPPAEPAAPQAAAQQPAAQQPASPKPLAQQTAPPAPEQAAQAPAPSDPNAPVRVEVTAEEAVWIRVEKDGKYVFSGTLEANQTRTVDASDKVLLKVGNAGGVSIVLNGKPVSNLGPKGQVRTVQFTSGGFEIIPAAKPAAPVEPFL